MPDLFERPDRFAVGDTVRIKSRLRTPLHLVRSVTGDGNGWPVVVLACGRVYDPDRLQVCGSAGVPVCEGCKRTSEGAALFPA